MTKYEERVRQRAEEMAKLLLPHVFEKQNKVINDAHIDNMTPLARLSVQREAEGVKAGMVAALFWGLNETNIHAKLEHDGLIPPKTETT